MNKTLIKYIFTALFLAAGMAATQAKAGDQLLFFDGIEARDHTSPVQTTYTFGAEFVHDFSEHFSWSIDNFNQGHFNKGIEHHRDFDGGNIWYNTNFFDRRLTLSAGFGALFYYDTTGGTYRNANEDVHGVGTSYTVAATWNTLSPFIVQVRANYIDAGSFNTKSLMLGVGYQLGGRAGYGSSYSSQASDNNFNEYKNEVTFYGGKAIVNEPGNGHSNAFGVEYRRDLGQYVQWSVGYLNEGKTPLADRQGVEGEAWLAKSFFDNRFSLGAGVGLYLAHDSMRAGDSTFVAPVRSFTLAYEVTPHLTVRATWDRPITNYNRDSDVAKFGIGYRF
jgi:hypothetical protein